MRRIGAFDRLILGNLDRITKYLDKSPMAVTEAVFGVLLVALAVKYESEGIDPML